MFYAFFIIGFMSAGLIVYLIKNDKEFVDIIELVEEID